MRKLTHKFSTRKSEGGPLRGLTSGVELRCGFFGPVGGFRRGDWFFDLGCRSSRGRGGTADLRAAFRASGFVKVVPAALRRPACPVFSVVDTSSSLATASVEAIGSSSFIFSVPDYLRERNVESAETSVRHVGSFSGRSERDIERTVAYRYGASLIAEDRTGWRGSS